VGQAELKPFQVKTHQT